MKVDLLVLGADGMDPRLLEYMQSKGYVPFITDVISETADLGQMASRVGSQSVPHTGPAWTTIYTGLIEREHGVTQGGWLLGDVSLTPHFEHTIFSKIAKAGCSVGSFTMPITYPAQTADGKDSWMVSGFPAVTDAPEKIVAPSEMESRLPDDFGKAQARGLFRRNERHKPVTEWIEAERKKVGEVLPRFIDDQPLDVLCYGTQIIDAMCHRARVYPRYISGGMQMVCDAVKRVVNTSIELPRLNTVARREEVRSAYQEVDNLLKTLVDMTNPDRILIISDHGFRLNGTDHSFVGTSIADGMDRRPEHIAEVSTAIYESLGIHTETPPVSEIDRSQETLTDDEQQKIKDQMASLGYLDEA